MRSTLPIAFLGLITSTYAQDYTVTWEEELPIGSSYVQTDVMFPVFMDTTSGTGITWDFSDIDLSSTTTMIQVVDPEDTPNGASFPSASHCTYYPASGGYYYAEHTSASHIEIGRQLGSTVRIYPDPYIERVYPMMVGSTHSDEYRTSPADFGTTAWYTVIGSGSLLLSGTTYPNVLLMRFTSEFSYPITSYKWIDASTGATLMLLRPADVEVEYGWALTNLEVGMIEPEEPLEAIVATLTEGNVAIRYASEMTLTYSILDPRGRELSSGTLTPSSTTKQAILNFPPASKGLYLVSLTDGHHRKTLRFVAP
ncbi:MAG: hypothetical protein IT230_09945 [Flavobacteriales bacterium]|nr:hypothetical protein [Flavobacteriales bacterium]